jgi:hypothetical protein
VLSASVKVSPLTSPCDVTVAYCRYAAHQRPSQVRYREAACLVSLNSDHSGGSERLQIIINCNPPPSAGGLTDCSELFLLFFEIVLSEDKPGALVCTSNQLPFDSLAVLVCCRMQECRSFLRLPAI